MISTTDPAIFLLTCLLLPLSMPIHWEGLYARDLLTWSCPGCVKDNLYPTWTCYLGAVLVVIFRLDSDIAHTGLPLFVYLTPIDIINYYCKEDLSRWRLEYFSPCLFVPYFGGNNGMCYIIEGNLNIIKTTCLELAAKTWWPPE